MITLGIETSCDETSFALYENGSMNRNGSILSSKIFSQSDIHSKFGGVVPEIASRNHIIKLEPLLTEILTESSINLKDIDLIGVTSSPGLIGALFIGVAFAKGLGYVNNIPVVPINHLQGHTLAAEITHNDLKPPYLSLIISGGHTHIYSVDVAYNFRLVARTVDDAVGESFDKVAKMLGFGYPGGPNIENAAKTGQKNKVQLPIGMKNKLNFSFSGLKTATMRALGEKRYSKEDIAASFQSTAVETLLLKTLKAVEKIGIRKIIICGGVASNNYLRNIIKEKFPKDIQVFFPIHKLCTDNGEMIAYTAYKLYRLRKFLSLNGTAYDSDPLMDRY